MKMFRPNFAAIHEAEDEPIDQERFEYVGKVKAERGIALARRMHKGKAVVQRCAVNLASDSRITQGIAKTDERIDGVQRWPARSP